MQLWIANHPAFSGQVGAYFGHAVAVSDVNGDGLDDVIIGAPMHTDFSTTDGRYETGRIYVVYQNAEVSFREKFSSIHLYSCPCGETIQQLHIYFNFCKFGRILFSQKVFQF